MSAPLVLPKRFEVRRARDAVAESAICGAADADADKWHDPTVPIIPRAAASEL